MPLVPFSAQLILEPGGSPAANTAVQVYHPSDEGFTTPLTVFELGGGTMGSLVTNDYGILPDFQVDLEGLWDLTCVIVPTGGSPQILFSIQGSGRLIEAFNQSVEQFGALFSGINIRSLQNQQNIAEIAPRTPGGKAVAQGELGFNVLDFGAVPDDTTDNTAAFQAAVDAASDHDVPGTAKTVYVPGGQGFGSAYLIENTINVPRNIRITGLGGRPWIRANTGATALFAFVDEPALGSSPQEGFVVENLAFKGVARGFIYAQGVAVFRVRRCFWHQTAGPVVRLEFCQDAKIEDCDVYAPNQSGGAALNHYNDGQPQFCPVVVQDSNNIYFDTFRIERTGSAAFWFDHALGIKVNGGKIDNNTGVPGMTDPFFVLEHDSDVKFTDFNLFRIENPVLVKDTSHLKFSYGCNLGGPVNSAVEIANPVVVHSPAGFNAGTLRMLSVEFEGCRIGSESNNSPNKVAAALSYASPETHLQAVNGGVTWDGYLRLQNRTTQRVGGRTVIRGQLQRFNGSTWETIPHVAGAFDGYWITDMVTGARANINRNQSAGLSIVLNMADDGVSFPNSTTARYRIDHGPEDGVYTSALRGVDSAFHTNKWTFTNAYRPIQFLTVDTATYNSAEGAWETTIVVDQDFTDDVPSAGHYVYNPDTNEYWRIKSASAPSTVVVEFDATSVQSAKEIWFEQGKLSHGSIDVVPSRGARTGGGHAEH